VERKIPSPYRDPKRRSFSP